MKQHAELGVLVARASHAEERERRLSLDEQGTAVTLAGIFVRGSVMPILPRKSVLAVAAVTDIALNARNRPVAAKALASRHRLPPRHLEPVLQALVREGILKGVRGPRGGYELAREQRRITVDDILRAARTVEDGSEEPVTGSALLSQVVAPAIAQAEHAFSNALSRISVEDLARAASALRKAGE